MTFGKNITPGNTVVLFIGVNMGTADISTSSVTTNGSADHWNLPTYTGFYNNVGISGFAIDFNSAGGSAVVDYNITQSVAATTSETTSVLLDAFEIAGLGPNPGVDAYTAGFNGGSTTTTWTSGSFPGDPAGANNGIFLGSVCLDINAANTTSAVAGPAGWTNEGLLSGSFQAGGTGTANKFFTYQLSGFSGPYNSSPPVLVYSGTNSAAAYTYGAWGISLFNGIVPSSWDGPVQALLPHPPAGPGSIRGRVASNQGAPVSNPSPPSTGPVFYPARQATRAKLPQQPIGTGAFKGRVASSPGGPVRNPAPGPVFVQKPKPVRYALPPWQPRAGRIGSSFGIPVSDPDRRATCLCAAGPVRARLPRLQPRAGRVSSNSGAPVRNPSAGPPVRALQQPVRTPVPKAFSKGRARSGPGTSTAVTYYVSPAGSDSSNGLSPATAWQTITKVNGTTLHPGDTVLFQGGQTFSGTPLQPAGSGAVNAPITFGSYGAGSATISTTANNGFYAFNAGNFVIENLDFSGSVSAGSFYGGIWIEANAGVNQGSLSISGCQCTGFTYGIQILADTTADQFGPVTVTKCTGNSNLQVGIDISGPAPGAPAW